MPADHDEPLEPANLSAMPRWNRVDDIEAAVTRASLRRRLFGVEDGGVYLGRFRLLRRLGSGASGDVSEAVEEPTGSHVAIKRLVCSDPELRVRIKREFRTLAEIAHPNLVQLYELFDDADQTYFTMELIVGRPMDEASLVADDPTDVDAIRAAFSQLASAIACVHDAGYLHLDIKPSNVLRCADGRVVLLDFGLSRTHAGHPLHDSTLVREGTPLYMAPEQLDGVHVGPAADWYAFGTMLYEMLHGRPPFSADRTSDLYRAKRLGRLADVSTTGAVIPGDLDALARGLLAPDPARRPNAAAVLACLGGAGPGGAPARVEAGVLIGRDDELARLHLALREPASRERPIVHVIGGSGMGKSALLERFAAEARTRTDLLVLRGRCHQAETVPFRGLDGVVDALSTVLAGMADARVSEILPRDIGPLTAVFPALERVHVIAAAPRSGFPASDAAEQRRRAFSSLRHLLARLADRRPVLVIADDWQWADRDADELAVALVEPPDPPAALFVLATRDGHTLAPPLDALVGVRVNVGPLGDDNARELLRRVAGQAGHSALREEQVLREAEGSPLFLVELARSPGGDRSTLSGYVEQRRAALSEEARRTLDVVALAGRPIPVSLALEAADVSLARAQPLLLELRRARLITATTGPPAHVEPSHDRIRELVAVRCPEQLARSLHRALAVAYARRPALEHASAAHHFHLAGDLGRAAAHAEEAAMRAAAGLAFEQSAAWYRSALAWGVLAPERIMDLNERLGEVLADAGRGEEAADAFAAAARLAPVHRALELRRRAAGQLLRCGHVDRGCALLRDVLRAVGLEMPSRPGVRVILERLRSRARGGRLRTRDASEIPPRVLARIDACWTAATGLGFIDLATSAAFFAHGTRLALQAGEPMRVSRWLSMQAIQTALPGGTARRGAERARALARHALHDDPTSRGLLRWAEGQGEHSIGNWRAALRACDDAVGLLQHEARGAWWETTSAQIVGESALYWLGDLVELRERVEQRVASGQARGDLFAVVTRRAGGLSAVGRLAADAPDRAADELVDALAQWTSGTVHVQHWYAIQARVQIELYRGEVARLWRTLQAEWPALERSRLLRVQPMRITSTWRRGIAAVAAADHDSTALAVAQAQVRRLARERMAWADVLVSLLAASIARRRADDIEAERHLRQGIERGRAAEMELLVTIASRRLGQLLGGDEGATLVEAADASMRERGVSRPDRFCEALLPWPA